jgi:hypothetical protein
MVKRAQERDGGRVRIYLASSWRNEHQPRVLAELRALGHEVYDFRNPQVQGPPGVPADGFSWKQTDPTWGSRLSPDIVDRYKRMLSHPRASEGFAADYDAMRWADAFVLLLPCGRSAHLEAGWALGRGKPTIVLLPEPATRTCSRCRGEGFESIHVIFELRYKDPCPVCNGSGLELAWGFEPELIYLLAGSGNIVTTAAEAHERLREAERQGQRMNMA